MAVSSQPKTEAPRSALAWVGPRLAFGGELPFAVACFEDSDGFLLSPAPFDFDLFVIRSSQLGVGGLDLIRLVRRRTSAGIVALCDNHADEFVAYLDAGSDMVLSPEATREHLRAAIYAVQRRVLQSRTAVSWPWKLVEADATLLTPEGKKIALSESDLVILRCFAANGGKVDRRALVEGLWGSDRGAMDNALHATLYRLRKRIEQIGQTQAPVYVVPKVGYEFRAPLEVVAADQSDKSISGSNMSRKRR